MKYQLLSLLLLAAVFFATGCEDDDGGTALPIKIRLLNATGEAMSSADLRFNWEGVTDQYQEYGSLAAGELSEELGFEAGGTCSYDLKFCFQDLDDCQAFIPFCECICPLAPGNYIGTITNIDSLGTTSTYNFDISLDE